MFFDAKPPPPTGPMTLDELLAHPGLRLLLQEAVERQQAKETQRYQDASWRWRQIHGTDKGFHEHYYNQGKT